MLKLLILHVIVLSVPEIPTWATTVGAILGFLGAKELLQSWTKWRMSKTDSEDALREAQIVAYKAEIEALTFKVEVLYREVNLLRVEKEGLYAAIKALAYTSPEGPIREVLLQILEDREKIQKEDASNI